MHDVSLAGAPARDDARARTTTAVDDALSVRLDALQRAVDDAPIALILSGMSNESKASFI